MAGPDSALLGALIAAGAALGVALIGASASRAVRRSADPADLTTALVKNLLAENAFLRNENARLHRERERKRP